MTRSISLAAFFVVILAGVFFFTASKGIRERRESDSILSLLAPRVQVVTSERDGGASKFQLAISTDPSSLSQMNRESAAVAARVRPSVVLLRTSYQADSSAKNQKKSASEPKVWTSSGVLIGNGDEILGVIPSGISPLGVQVRFQDGREAKADFIGRDDSTEIALLKLESSAPEKPLAWRNRRSLDWGEHFYALARNSVHGPQMVRVMVSGDAILSLMDGKTDSAHYRQLDQVLPADFQGAVLVDGTGQVAGLVIRPDADEQLRALVLDGGSVRAVAEALRSLQKKE